MHQPVDGEAALVRDPLLVDLLVEARQDAHHLRPARIDADIAANGIEHIDRLGLAQLPRAGDEGVGLRGQRADRAQIDHVARQLGGQRFLDVGADLHVLAASGSAEFLDAGDLGGEADAAGAVDAAIHAGLDQRAEILVLDRPLVLLEAAAVEAIGHGLVLQVALTALIADRAVERVIDEQELHHRAGGDRLRRLLLLDQAHAAVAGDRQPLVKAEMWDLDAKTLARLQHRGARRYLDLLSVDRQFRHAFSSNAYAARARTAASR